MAEYEFKSYSKYNNVGQIEEVQSAYRAVMEAGYLKAWEQEYAPIAHHEWNDAAQVSFKLMCTITFKQGTPNQLPDNLVILVGKALGFTFKSGFWKVSKYKTKELALELLKKDHALVYDQDFWAELEYFTEGWLDRTRLFTSIGMNVATLSLYGGHTTLMELPDGNCFSAPMGGGVRQLPVGTLRGDRWHGWFIATANGWKKYSDIYGEEATTALRWLIVENDGQEVLAYYDLHGMDHNFNPKTIHKEGQAMPAYHATVTLDTGIGDGIRAMVAEDGSLVGLSRGVVNYNGEGERFTLATPAMSAAWEKSQIKNLLNGNQQIRKH